MKTKHKLILFLALILWICYAALVVRSYLDYSAYVSTTIAKYEQRGIPRAYIELYPYIQYGYSGAIIASGFIYLLITVELGLHLYKPKPKISKVASLSLIFLLMVSIVPVMLLSAKAATTTLSAEYVQCCMYFDEECSSANHRQWLYGEFFSHGAGISTYDKFKDYYNLIFICENGYNSFWNSNNGVSDTYDLLQEAIYQAGGVWDATNGWWIWPGKDMLCSDGFYRWIDCLIVICNQPMDMLGFSPPMWNAMITNFSPDTYVCMHELSHQFWCEHCGGFCCMNPNLGMVTPECWCGTCSAFITSHREKWGAKQLISIDIMAGGHGYTDPCVGTHERVIGLSVTIQAFPDSVYMFTKWTFVSTYGVTDITDNPYTFTMPAYDYVIHTSILRQRTLTITKIGRGSTNPPVGTYIYPNNADVSVTATADADFAFKYWKLDGVTYTSNPIDVYMGSDHTLQAYFTQDYRLQVEIYNGDGTTNLEIGEYWFYEGTEVTIMATPSTGYRFTCWIIDGDYDILLTLEDRLCLAFGAVYDNPVTVTMDSNHVVSVVFNPNVLLFPIYNNDGEWLANDCTIAYRRSGQIIINGSCHGNYPWQYDFFEIDQDARDDGKFTIDCGGGITFSCDITLLPTAAFEHYNYCTMLPSGIYDFIIQCPGYQTKYFYNVVIPADESYFIGLWTVILQEGSDCIGGCSGCSARLCVC